MNLFRRVNDNPFPTPDTIDVLAEVSEFRQGKDLGRSALTLKSLASMVSGFAPESDEARTALVHLAAHAVARIELIDRGEFVS